MKARAPGRVSILGEGLLGPTLIQYGTEAQQDRFLPRIVDGTELWCQGYSEPNAGSDLANVATRAELDGDEWVITGQKVWTSLAHQSDWCFVVCRTEPGSARHKGLSYLLVPMDQPGVEIRPITQLTRTSEFNEVFFDGARTAPDLVVGEAGRRLAGGPGHPGLRAGRGPARPPALASDGSSTSSSTLARQNGRAADPVLRQRLARSYAELEDPAATTRCAACRATTARWPRPRPRSSSSTGPRWHQQLGELAMDVRGPAGLVAEGAPTSSTSSSGTFLFSRSETIYGGSNEIQRNIIGERVLGLPPEPKGDRSDADRHRAAPPDPDAASRPRPARRARSSWSRRRPAPASASPRPGAASRRGPTVVVSDAHERRLGEAADALAELRRRPSPLAIACDVTDESEVQALYDAAVAEHGRIDVAVNNAGLGGTVHVVDMTDEQWAPVLDVTLDRDLPVHPGRPAPLLRPGRRGHRQQRLGARLAGPGRARPTTRRPRPA